ncbi:MAG: ExeA family protein [Planctomycetota bacterium]|jgi:type II secretory pathway predicted ATPase ExeA
MYASFFGLRELPFNNTPDPRFFYSTPDHEEALASLIYAVQERKGFVLLTGETGAGKTLVSRIMLQHFETRIAFATINHALGSGGDLLESICTEFELPVEARATHTQLVRTLHDFLLAKFAQDTSVVLVLDEAQTLPVDVFEQVRMIGNLEADDAKLLQVAIFGQPELQRTFASPALRQLRQRIFRSFHLPALTPEETEGYIHHRLSVAGAHQPDFFDAEAIARIYEHSSGLPRIINTLCDNAMLSAYSAGCHSIGGAFIGSVVQQMMAFGDAASGGFDHGTGTAASAPRQCSRMPRPPGPGHDYPSRATAVSAMTAGVEGKLADDRRYLAEARAAHDHLKPLVVQAGSLAKRSKTNMEELTRCETRMRELAVNARRVIDEARPIFDRLTRAAVYTGHAERVGHKMCERLTAQTERARRIAGKLDNLAARLSATAVPAVSTPVTGTEMPCVQNSSTRAKIIRKVTKPIVDPGHSPTAVSSDAPQQDRLRKMLISSRTSLAELRTFVQTNRSRGANVPSLRNPQSEIRDPQSEIPNPQSEMPGSPAQEPLVCNA